MSKFTIYEDGNNFINGFEANDTPADVNTVSTEVERATIEILEKHEEKSIKEKAFTIKLFGFDHHTGTKYRYRFYCVGIVYEDGTSKSYRVKGEYEN
ncbi:hypothetical protein [Priestia megaterium]|uniref:hypothetical protein n=1 Tax=Priestia megaterium TaxID=1404 RepID=UPI0025B2658D|nr:hypothetical protein [Priestia megaterium]MDN3233104.1 hypothetical protein [Priestia megaterium]